LLFAGPGGKLDASGETMIAALIAAFAMVALLQFSLSWWRAAMADATSRPFSERMKAVAAHCGLSMESEDFDALRGLLESCPELDGQGQGIRRVQLYYRALSWLRMLSARALPALADWASKEMALCSRYAAVMVDQRLARTQALMAELRSF
jgi:hypothetical protein